MLHDTAAYCTALLLCMCPSGEAYAMPRSNIIHYCVSIYILCNIWNDLNLLSTTGTSDTVGQNVEYTCYAKMPVFALRWRYSLWKCTNRWELFLFVQGYNSILLKISNNRKLHIIQENLYVTTVLFFCFLLWWNKNAI